MTVAGCKRIVCWGHPGDKHSHRWIWHSFTRAARKMGLDGVMMAGTPEDRQALKPGDLVMAIDIWDQNLAPAIPGVKYALHNFPGDHVLFDSVGDDFIRLQVYTNAAHGEKLGPCRYWVAENRTLIQPWGTDLLAEEFYDPVFNPTSREAVFVGAIWDTAGQGNATEIGQLSEVLASRKLELVVRTHVSEEEMIELIRKARIAPAIAGAWQVENNYLPCRVFKNVSYGQVAITNVPRFFDLFRDESLIGESIEELVHESLEMRRGEYLEMAMAQQKVVAGFTYRESLQAIDKVLS